MASMTAGRPRNLPPPSEVDVRQIIHEAQTRWLRPVEVCEILRNYKLHNFKLSPVPPTQPQSGSLFLFDRKALRYFRKDGHNWRKKKDGKTVREAHERLKAGSVDVLHCYYAHGEDNVNFQRRCYWMLDPAYEHIVLVHYRAVTENNRSCIIRNTHDYSNSNSSNSVYAQFAGQHQHVSPAVSSLTNTSLTSSVASPETVEAVGASLSSELDEVDSEAPDELEDSGLEIEGGIQADQSGLQFSLQQQLGDQQLTGGHALPGSSQWQNLGGNGKGLSVMDAQFPPIFSPQDTDFKPSFSDIQQQHQRIDLVPRGASNSVLGGFSPGGDVSSISRRFADMLDSPGTSYGSPSQQSGTFSTPLELAGLTSLVNNGSRGSSGNGAMRFVKPEVNSLTWAEMFAQVTTPSTRRTLLENHGLHPGLGQSQHGKDTSPALGAPLSPKGIVDALSPRNLGRVPQTPLEANLRAVTEKEVLKEAEEKAQAQRNRWQTTQTEHSSADAVIHRTQDLAGSHQVSGDQFMEPDTLERLVRSGQSLQDSYSSSGAKDKGAWMQQAPQQTEQPVPSFSSFDQQTSRIQQEKLQPIVPPPQSNGFTFMEQGGLVNGGGLFSPTVEHYLKDVQSEEVAHQDVMESYKKLDSFGRWMNSEYAESLAPYLSGGSSAWDSVPLDGLSQMHMDGGLNRSPSISELCFDISDFSPEWGSSNEETKVLISGTFVGSIIPSDHRWACMFGEIEVPAELIDGGALRCKAPKREAGKVDFYVTRSDRYACSQIREFEYRSVVPPVDFSESERVEETPYDVLLKVRFSRMLFATTSSRTGTRAQTFKESEDDEWRQLESMLAVGKPVAVIKEQLMQLIFKRRLREWLQVKGREDGKGASVHDDHGQGVSHFTAALGYIWSIGPQLKADIPINFRDENGWTALHWAAHCGREDVVCALLEAAASPSCLTYCNKQDPQGLTAADLAYSQGHIGLAAFLSEKALTTRLMGLNLEDGIQVDENSAVMAGEKAVAALARRSSIRSSVRVEKDQAVLETSLEAVRHSTQAAAKLKEVFRQLSFRRRQQLMLAADDEVDEYGLSGFEVRSMLAAQKIQKAYRGHQKKKLHHAAIAIQRKFRGWKGRKDYQTVRQRIIKLQAHVRGRLVRKQFRKILWSVSIVEKVVLRWLRKRKGLRGFRNASESLEVPSSLISDDDDDLTKEGRHRNHQAVEKDVQRVRQMTREKAAREQYSRLRQRISKGEPYSSLYTDHGSGSGDFMLNQDSVMTTEE